MTREEATNLLYRLKFFFDHTRERSRHCEQLAKALGMAIESLQTDIVRCKDCRWQEECSQFVVLHKFCGVYQEISFCSHGERRNP